MWFNWRHGSFKIRACEICGRGGMRETSAIPAIRSRTRYKGMVPRTIQWKSSRPAWNQLRERMPRPPLYSFAFSRRGTKRAWITRHRRKTRTSLPSSRNLFMQISTASHLTPLKPRAPRQIFTRRRYLYEPLNARSTRDTFFFFLGKLEEKKGIKDG